MKILEASAAILKGSAQAAWWGLGIFIGLHIAGALAKPLAGEVSKGLTTLRSILKKEEPGAETGDRAAESPTEKKQAAAADKPFKIPVEDVAPAGAAPGAEVELSGSQEEPEAVPDQKTNEDATASTSENDRGEMPSLKWLKADLLEEAVRLGISVRETMTKKELLDAILTRTE